MRYAITDEGGGKRWAWLNLLTATSPYIVRKCADRGYDFRMQEYVGTAMTLRGARRVARKDKNRKEIEVIDL